MPQRFGCLVVLGLLLAAAWVVLGGTAEMEPEGGARLAAMGAFALAVIYVHAGFAWLRKRLRAEPRGFPIESAAPPPASQEDGRG